MTTPHLDDLHQWLSVSFYAQVPIGQRVTDVDTAATIAALIGAFGFTAITGLTIAVARAPITYTVTQGGRTPAP